MEHFAGYGFNKSHSTAYALLAYQTAYLKANYPWHFAAALLTIEAQNTDKLALYLGECRDRGIPVLAPDINRSELRFTVTDEGVRFGLTAVKNVGDGAIQSILARRAALGTIRSLHDLCEDVDLRLVNKRVLESLVKAGALDSLAGPVEGPAGRTTRLVRARLMAAIDAALDHGGRSQRDRDLGQADLFGGPREEAEAPHVVPLPEVRAWTESEQLAGEKEALGLYWSGHPIDSYAEDLREYGARPIAELVAGDSVPTGSEGPAPHPGGSAPQVPGARRGGGDEVTAGGIVAAVRPLKTRKGDRMAVFTLEDRHGGLEVIVFPETFSRCAALVETGTLVAVRGKLERDEDEARLLASEVVNIGTVRERVARELAITVAVPPHGRETFEALAALFDKHRGDKPVMLQLELRDKDRPLRVRAQVSSQVRVRASAAFVADVTRLCGDGSVSLR
jgi:DNA polymerase III subunit alpha